jgi:hypothetical protein
VSITPHLEVLLRAHGLAEEGGRSLLATTLSSAEAAGETRQTLIFGMHMA